MIDVINATVFLYADQLPPVVCNSDISPFYWQNLHFFPNGEYSYRANNQSLADLSLDNMSIRFGTGETAKLKISNSLHKVSHSGLNHTDFTKSQLIDVIDYMCKTLDIFPSNFKLQGDFEFSVNIQVDNAKSIIENANKYKNKHLLNMTGNNKVYGKKAEYTNYSIKIYNPLHKLNLDKKTRGLKIEDTNDTLRIEVTAKVDYICRVWSIPLHNLESLQDDEVLTALGARLSLLSEGFIFDNKPPDMDFLETRTWYLFTHITEEETKQYNKGKGKSNFYKERDKYRELITRVKQEELAPKIDEKWAFLQSH